MTTDKQKTEKVFTFRDEDGNVLEEKKFSNQNKAVTYGFTIEDCDSVWKENNTKKVCELVRGIRPPIAFFVND